MSRNEPQGNPGLIDVVAGLLRWRTWTLLSYYDFIGSYRKTSLGPLWQIVHVSAWIFGLWLIFGENRGDSSLIYIGSGVVCWGLIQSTLAYMPNVFQANSGLILNIPNPLSLHIYRRLSEQFLRWLVQLPIIVLLVFLFQAPWGFETLMILPALVIVLTGLVGASLFLGVLGARFPDVKFAVDAALRLSFFLTPIFWHPGDDPLRTLLATWNPFTYMIDILRQPLMGEVPSVTSFGVSSLLALLAVAMGLVAFGYTRNKILYWI